MTISRQLKQQQLPLVLEYIKALHNGKEPLVTTSLVKANPRQCGFLRETFPKGLPKQLPADWCNKKIASDD